MLRIGDGGRTAGHNELVVGRGVNQLRAGHGASLLLHSDVVLRDDVVHLRGARLRRLARRSLNEKYVNLAGRHVAAAAAQSDSALEMCDETGVVIDKLLRLYVNGRGLAGRVLRSFPGVSFLRLDIGFFGFTRLAVFSPGV